MADKKISRKELLKEPDEFLSASAQVMEYVREKPRQVLLIAVLVVAGIAGALGYYTYSKHRAQVSHQLLQNALHEYETVFQSQKPASPKQLDKLLSRFEYISRHYPSSAGGEVALLYEGHILFKKSDFKAALERYRKAESTSIFKEGLRELIWYNIAKTYLALGNYNKAMNLFEKLSKDTDSPYRREAYANIARIYELTERRKEAVQAYKQYLKMFPEAPDAAFVKSRIADLSTRG